MPLLQREGVGLGLFPHPTPHDRTALLVHLEHVAPCRGFVEAKYLFKHQYDVRHQVDGIVQHDHAPSALILEFGCPFGRGCAVRLGMRRGHAFARASPTAADTFASASASGTLTRSFCGRHFNSMMPSLRPLPPMVSRSGMPIKSASLNFTPGRSARSSMRTSAPACSAAAPNLRARSMASGSCGSSTQ